MKDKEIEDCLKFIIEANKACKEIGKQYVFTCPLCGKKARAIRNSYNSHLWAKCENCNMQVIQ